MDLEKLDIIKNRKGFIAALDQSGGSTARTLLTYGITDNEYKNENEMFDLIHEMRKRVLTSPYFTKEKIIGSILFFKTMNSKVDNEYTADYLWNKKKIVSFLKIDKGLKDLENGCKLMKGIPDLESQCSLANKRHIFGTKMRSVIYDDNKDEIQKLVDQQFAVAKKICKYSLVPIIEPEVDIHSPKKEKIEEILKEMIVNKLKEWNSNDLIMFKFTIPTKDNFYDDLYNYPFVLRILALSGGYKTEEACKLLKNNKHMIASFSRALLQDLRVSQSDEEFNRVLKNAIDKIYDASI